jgi:hypothetical protein
MDKSTPAAFHRGNPDGRVWKGEKAFDYSQIRAAGQISRSIAPPQQPRIGGRLMRQAVGMPADRFCPSSAKRSIESRQSIGKSSSDRSG